MLLDIVDKIVAMFALAILLNALMLIPHFGHAITIATAFTLGRFFGWDRISLRRLFSARATEDQGS